MTCPTDGDEPIRVELFIDGRAIAQTVARENYRVRARMTRSEFAQALAAQSISGYEYHPPERRTACPPRRLLRLPFRLRSLFPRRPPWSTGR